MPAATLDALASVSTDPEPLVRATATRSLVARRDARVVPVLTARLRDRARVVRAIAAWGLLELGVTSLPGPNQPAFVTAQEEYARSLAEFPDSANNQVAIGILRARQGRYADAIREWELGRRLDPADPRFGRLIAAAKARQ